MRKPALVLLALTLASAGGLARAQQAGPPPKAAAPPAAASRPQARLESEVRCLLVMSMVASRKERQQAGLLGVYFFSGRILQLNPAFDFAAGIRVAGSQMNQETFRAELPRCGALVERAAAQLRAAQQTLAPRKPAPAAGSAQP